MERERERKRGGGGGGGGAGKPTVGLRFVSETNAYCYKFNTDVQ